MYDTLLVPIDETAETTRLLERAIDVADPNNTTIHVLGLVDGPAALNAEGTGATDRVQGARERARRAAMRAAERAQRGNIAARQSVRRGIPHSELVAEAERVDADLILLGPSGRETTEGSVCTGTVTNAVVDRTECAVLVEPLDGDSQSDSPSSESAPAERVSEEAASLAPDA